MYLNTPKDVTREHRPSLITSGTHVMFWIFDVNGAATEASASDNEIPTCASGIEIF